MIVPLVKQWKIKKKRINHKAGDHIKICKQTKFCFTENCKNFVAIHEIKPILTLDKPNYIGFSILDLSKLVMYEFHYKYTRVPMLNAQALSTFLVLFPPTSTTSSLKKFY